MASLTSLRERSLVNLSFIACMTLVRTLFQHSTCASTVPGARVSEEYMLAYKFVMYKLRSLWPMTVPSSVSSSHRRVLFFPMRWKLKKALEQVSPYLNHLNAERCWLRSTEFWKTSASLPCAYERMPCTSAFVGSLWSWTSTN